MYLFVIPATRLKLGRSRMYIRVRRGSKTVIYHGPRATTRARWRLFRKLAINMRNDMKRDVFPTGHARKERGVLPPAMSQRNDTRHYFSPRRLYGAENWGCNVNAKYKIQSILILIH